MAQIVKYTASEQLDTDRGGMPRPQMSNAVGQALQGLGSAVGNFADLGAKAKQKQDQKDEFKTASDYRKFNATLQEEMERAAESMQPDGSGFHKTFMEEKYRPARDAFMANVPNDELRERYNVLLGDNGEATVDWSIRAAGRERDQTTLWYKQELGIGQQELATAIAKDPKGYDVFLKQGLAEIEAADIPTAEKMKERAAWENMAQIAHLNRMIEMDPEGVLFELDADPRNLAPTTQFEMLRKAVRMVESGGDPNAVSPKGAAGIMQVMPDTADEIAKELGDKNFDPKWSDEEKRRYLKNEVIGGRYGDHYLKKQIREFGQYGLEAALVAYNGGPSRARAWIKSGFDDSVIPKESADYYKKIMKRLPGTRGDSALKGSAKSVKLIFDDKQVELANRRGSVGGEKGVNPELAERVRSSFGALGIDEVKINSGHRSAEHNESVGGAKGSQHVQHNAMDIDVTGYTHAERVQIIQMLSSNGITGLGIGNDIIHADLGGRRVWGYANSAGGGEVPPWAKAATDAHLEGKSVPPVRGANGGSGRYASLPYNERQKFIQLAGNAVTQRGNEITKANTAQRIELQRAMDSELASIYDTGQGVGVDDTQVATVLGEDDYLKWMQKKTTAQRTYSAKLGISAMTPQEMADRLGDYEPVPGSSTYESDAQVERAVDKEIKRVERLRSNSPDKAAMEFEDVSAAFAKVQGGMENGQQPDPGDVQAFVATMINRQKDFNLKPGSEAPVPREWGLEIGRTLSKIPELAGKNRQDVVAAITVQYQALQEVFGPYTEEVIIYALSEYKGVGPNTAVMMTKMMQAIESGGDPLKLKRGLDQAEDMDEIESLAEDGWWSTVKRNALDFWNGTRSEDEDEDPGPPEAGMSAEERLRAAERKAEEDEQ